ncbi:MAG: M56 family metallopeptidase [Phycisphaerae bacterium]|jgi:beta-lactamase regulating signal transducer with metallopeptidase domain|nr:M56 family metallopeptidase [Phycisphaerae bacterium]
MPIDVHQLDPLLVAWWEWILPLSAQLAALALIVAAIDLLFVRRPRPRFESLLWALVFVKVVLPPSLASPVSIMRLAGAPPMWTAPEEIAIGPVRWAMVLWLAGVILLGAWVLVQARRTVRLLGRSTTPAPPSVVRRLEAAARRVGLRSVPRARMVPSIAEAAVFGLCRPTVLVPMDLVHDPRRLEHVLLHECAHIKRGDLWWSSLTLVLTVVLWFHPAMWIARGRLAALRELACDGHVARVLGRDADAYRQTLVSLARSILAHSKPMASGHLSFLATPRGVLAGRWRSWCVGWWGRSLLVVRLVHLRDWEEPTGRSRLASGLLALIVTVALAASCIPLANPPRPLWEEWAHATGCLQKRFLLLQALPPEGSPFTPVSTP